MAEKKDKKAEPAEKKDAKGAAPAAEAAPAAAAPAAGGGIGAMLTKTPVILGGVMILEAVVLFAGFKFLGSGAKNAQADLTTELQKESTAATTAADADQDGTVEIELLDSKFPNKLSGRTFLYDVSIALSVKSQFADKVKKEIGDHDALIKDRVRTIIAQLDPDKLGGGSEPGLETLRRQVKYQLDEIVGDGMIDEVLVPKCLSFRTDY
jgi:flagellar basal body-associated protein FliL